MPDSGAITEDLLLGGRYSVEPIDSLEAHPENPNEGDVGGIYESILENKFFGALIVQEARRRILVGEHRWNALRAAGGKVIPVIFVDVDDEEALRIMLADNAERDKAAYNLDRLHDLLSRVSATPKGLSGTGYDHDGLQSLVDRLNQTGIGYDSRNDPTARERGRMPGEPAAPNVARKLRDFQGGGGPRWCPHCGEELD